VAKWNFWSIVDSNEVKVFLTLTKAFSKTSTSNFATHDLAHAVLRVIHAGRAKKRWCDFSSTDKSAFT
jgi:hypothetical protein